MTTHHMKLQVSPFEQIAAGSKTIEVRLYDEKRQGLQVGDKIIFSRLDGSEGIIETEVMSLEVFPTFKDLFSAYTPSTYGASRADEWESMYAYYSPEDEQKCGVLAIGIRKK